jgi:hypothetical protein
MYVFIHRSLTCSLCNLEFLFWLAMVVIIKYQKIKIYDNNEIDSYYKFLVVFEKSDWLKVKVDNNTNFLV